jgi:ketosteroid isomerase-like protein
MEPEAFFQNCIDKEISMKSVWMVGVVALLSLGSAAWSNAQAGGGTEKTVAGLEQKWMESQRANNPDLVAPLLADKFVSTSADGKVTSKAESLAAAKKTKYSSVDYLDLKVTVFGNTAIAVAGFKAKGTDAEGKPLDVNERFTDTWVKMGGGKWQCVASHSSPVK